MNRRKFLTGVATGAAIANAGCVGLTIKPDPSEQDNNEATGENQTLHLALEKESDYFESVQVEVYDDFIFPMTETLTVNLSPTPPAELSAVVVSVDGVQADFAKVTTGSTKVDFDVHLEDKEDVERKLELLAVSGGEENMDVYEGGEILERVPITIKR